MSVPPPPPTRSSSNHSSKLNERQDSINQDENSICKLGVTRSNSEPSSKQNFRCKSTPPENGELIDRIIGDADNNAAISISNKLIMVDNLLSLMPSTSSNSLSSVGSQDSVVDGTAGRKSRQQILEERHQALIKKQKRLQEQYLKLQQLSRVELPKKILNELKKTGSESNLILKSKNQVPNLNCSVPNGYLPTTNDINQQFQSTNKNTILTTNSLSSPNKTNQMKIDSKTERNDLSNQLNSSTETQKIFESSII